VRGVGCLPSGAEGRNAEGAKRSSVLSLRTLSCGGARKVRGRCEEGTRKGRGRYETRAAGTACTSCHLSFARRNSREAGRRRQTWTGRTCRGTTLLVPLRR